MGKSLTNLERIQKSCEAVVLRLRNKRRTHHDDMRAHLPYIAIVAAAVIFVAMCCGTLVGERATSANTRHRLHVPNY